MLPVFEPLCRLQEAGDGNRTHVASLEGWGSTIELRPQSLDRLFRLVQNARPLSLNPTKLQSESTPRAGRCEPRPCASELGEVGFEPTKAEPPDLQSGPFDHSGIPPELLTGELRFRRLSHRKARPRIDLRPQGGT